MKRTLRSLAGVALLACCAPFAQAGLIIDQVDVSQLVAEGQTVSATHDLSGRIPGSEYATGGILLLLGGALLALGAARRLRPRAA